MGNPDTSYWGTSAATACPLSTMIAVAAIGNVFIMMISTTVVAEPCRDTAAFAAWVLQMRLDHGPANVLSQSRTFISTSAPCPQCLSNGPGKAEL
jgi:hypothetical protein